MAKRRRFSRWRRLPGVYRIGDDKPPDPNLEPERLSLYITGHALDRAEAQATRFGFETVQEYCAEVLVRAIDAEHVREHVAEVEAKRGTLEGLHEIAEDPEFLADLSAAAAPREITPRADADPPVGNDSALSALTFRLDGVTPAGPGGPRDGPEPRAEVEPSAAPVPSRTGSRSALMTQTLSPAAMVVMRHAGQSEDDPHAFLPCLRRGDPVPPSEVGELAQSLHELEIEYRSTPAMDRRLTFALHRLAFESQILHTDAWPGSFDMWTVDMLRAVQEAVERILSGQDIRYYPVPDQLFPAPRPEVPL